MAHRDVVKLGFPAVEGGVDALFLDLPNPWVVSEVAAAAPCAPCRRHVLLLVCVAFPLCACVFGLVAASALRARARWLRRLAGRALGARVSGPGRHLLLLLSVH